MLYQNCKHFLSRNYNLRIFTALSHKGTSNRSKSQRERSHIDDDDDDDDHNNNNNKKQSEYFCKNLDPMLQCNIYNTDVSHRIQGPASLLHKVALQQRISALFAMVGLYFSLIKLELVFPSTCKFQRGQTKHKSMIYPPLASSKGAKQNKFNDLSNHHQINTTI